MTDRVVKCMYMTQKECENVRFVYLSASGAVCVVEGAAAGMAGREIHHSIRTTHGVKQLLNTVTSNVTAYGQIAQI